MTVKSEITKKLKTLEKCGWRVYTMNDRRATGSGTRGLPDHILFKPSKGITIYAEIKIGRDKLNPDQELFRLMISGEKFYKNQTYYLIITDRTIDDMVLQIAKY